MAEVSFEIWKDGKRLGVAADKDPLAAFQEAIKAVDGKEGYEIHEVRRKRVWPMD